MKAIDQEDKKKFLNLACALSPENLSCDGEISMAETRRKEGTIRNQWKDLEKKVGREVSEDEVWQWSFADATL